MASTATPYGLRAVNELGGLPYAGSTRSFLIDPAGYSVNIFNGSIVSVVATGYLEIVTTVGSSAGNIFPAGTIGVFVGCSYTNTQGQTVFSQYYPANATNAVAFVIDDDRTVFQVQAAGTLAQAALGQNAILQAVQSTSTGSTTTGNSTTAISISTAVTATYGLKIVGFVQSTTSTVGDAYTDVLVKFNIGSHAYNTGTGI
jgi:hypothetical protein